jgi:uncharacterized protein (TIGR00251 family)
MRVSITVVPRARRPGVRLLEDGRLRVAVAAPAEAGRANDAVIAALADHFGVPRSRVRIVLGARSRRKVAEIAAHAGRAAGV